MKAWSALAGAVAAAVRRAWGAVGRAWDAIRPRTVRGAALFVVLAAGLSLGIFAGATVASSAVAEYSFQPGVDSAAWRALRPSYGEVALCATCHDRQYARLTSATHAGIGCESCHGPSGAHALARPGTAEAELDVVVPNEGICLTCHLSAEGRPAGFRQIVPDDHYTTACLACHDPHTGISRRPPTVEHPLDNLPPCITCHGPDGFKARNQRHPTVAGDDPTCLACHESDRRPAGSAVAPDRQVTGWR
jgi:hypothetical protein